MPICVNCGNDVEYVYNDAAGETLCPECGVLVEENQIVAQVEFLETNGGGSSVVGQYVSATSTKPYGVGTGYGVMRESREIAIENGRKMIQKMAAQLTLPSHIVEAAHRLYILAVQNQFTHGRRTTHVVAACLYIVCRREKQPHLLIDFAEALATHVYSLGATFMKLMKLLALQLPLIDPSLYIHRFAGKLELGDATHAVAQTALRLVARMRRDWIQTGRRPAGICGACLLIAARVHGFRRTRAEVQSIVRVTEVTLKNRLAEFENTPSSLLTLDEFENLELTDECDPPAFIRGMLEDEIARERIMLEEAMAQDSQMLIADAATEQPTPVGLLMDGAPTDADGITDSGAGPTPHARAVAAAGDLRPTIPAAAAHVTNRRLAEHVVTEGAVEAILARNPTLAAALDRTLLVSERDIGPALSAVAAGEVVAEQLRLNKPAEFQTQPQAYSGATSERAAEEEDLSSGWSSDEGTARRPQPADGSEEAPTDRQPPADLPALATAAVEEISEAAQAAGLEGVSRKDIRLWKARALLQRDWGRGRDAFMHFRRGRETLVEQELQRRRKVMEAADEIAREAGELRPESYTQPESLLNILARGAPTVDQHDSRDAGESEDALAAFAATVDADLQDSAPELISEHGRASGSAAAVGKRRKPERSPAKATVSSENSDGDSGRDLSDGRGMHASEQEDDDEDRGFRRPRGRRKQARIAPKATKAEVTGTGIPVARRAAKRSPDAQSEAGTDHDDDVRSTKRRPRKTRYDEHDSVYMTLAEEMTSQAPAEGAAPPSAAASNRLLYDRLGVDKMLALPEPLRVGFNAALDPQIRDAANRDYEPATDAAQHPVSEALSDSESDIDEYLIPTEEAQRRQEIWTELNAAYLKAQSDKKAAKGGAPSAATTSGAGAGRRAAETPQEALRTMMAARKRSAAAVSNAAAPVDTLFELSSSAAAPVPQPAASAPPRSTRIAAPGAPIALPGARQSGAAAIKPPSKIVAPSGRPAATAGAPQATAVSKPGAALIRRPLGAAAAPVAAPAGLAEAPEEEDFVVTASYGGASAGDGEDDYGGGGDYEE